MNRYKLTKAGVNINEGLRRLDNDMDFYEELLEKFCNDHHYVELKKAMDSEDVENAFKEAHALKGITGNLSCVRLYDALVPLVEKLRSKDYAEAKPLFADVTEAYRAVMEAMGYKIKE